MSQVKKYSCYGLTGKNSKTKNGSPDNLNGDKITAKLIVGHRLLGWQEAEPGLDGDALTRELVLRRKSKSNFIISKEN